MALFHVCYILFISYCTVCVRTGMIDTLGIIAAIRLPLMTIDELLNDVRASSLVCPDAILDAIKVKNESRNNELKYRGFLCKFTSPLFVSTNMYAVHLPTDVLTVISLFRFTDILFVQAPTRTWRRCVRAPRWFAVRWNRRCSMATASTTTLTVASHVTRSRTATSAVSSSSSAHRTSSTACACFSGTATWG